MPAFSLYIKEDLLSQVHAEIEKVRAAAPSSTVSVASYITGAVREKLARNRPRTACVGREGVSWTTAMPAEDAARTQLSALNAHPGLVVYYLPEGFDTSSIVPGAAIPPGATIA